MKMPQDSTQIDAPADSRGNFSLAVEKSWRTLRSGRTERWLLATDVAVHDSEAERFDPGERGAVQRIFRRRLVDE